MNSCEFSLKLDVKRNYDIIVAGGGVAGCAAAVSAAERGHSVLLIEKSNILGGLGTLGLINFFVPMCNGNGKQIIFGYVEKWLRQSAEIGYNTIPDCWKKGEPSEPTTVRYTQRYSPYVFAVQLLEDVMAAGVDLLYDCQAAYPVMEGKICKGLVTDSKSGLELYGCKMLIDTTGDADVLRRSGMPTAAGQNYYTYIAKCISLASCKNAVEKGDIHFAYEGFSGGNINLFGDNQPNDIPRWSGLTVEEVTDYLIRNQRLMLDKFKAFPQGEKDIAMLTMMPNFRTTCHIKGDYSLKVSDCYRHFDDSVCAINDFEHRYHLFEIPYRCLTNREYPNMITAGRSADGTGYGWDLIRVIPPAILTGQAAGEACALALENGLDLSSISVPELQNRLEKQNVMIHFPDSYVPENKSVIIHGRDLTSANEDHIE